MSTRPLCLAACSAMALLAAADPDHDLRILPQITAGTHGFNAGAAFEWRPSWRVPLVVRPEAFVNDDFDFGGGASVQWRFADLVRLDDRHDLGIGPRVVHHGGDDYGLEMSVMASWNLDLRLRGERDRHYAQFLIALGGIEDEDDDDTDFAITVGAAYGFRF
jgi:hypothetical protein